MGLDLALGVIILIAAFRGWFRGFISQSVRLLSVVAGVYEADRVRDYVKPYIIPYLSSIQPDLVDRLLWWVSALVTYLVLFGGVSIVIKMTRRPEIPGISQSGRNDQFAGFFLGGAKGFLLAVFIAAGIQTYGMEQAKSVSWAEEQVKASWALRWNETYQPAKKIWRSRPVQHFVDHIQRLGLQRPDDASTDDSVEDSAVRTASRQAESDTRTDDRFSTGSKQRES